MKTIFNFDKWDDPELVAKWFKSRLDWDNPLTPQYSGTGKSRAVNWAQGLQNDFAKYKSNEGILNLVDLRRTVMFRNEYLILPQFPNGETSMLVGNFLMNTGRLTIEAEFSGNPNVVEAIWALSPARYESSEETILPEYDFFETNTPGHIGEMSTSVITSYDPYKATRVKKKPIETGRRTYVIDIHENSIHTNFKRTLPRWSDVPIYPIIWNIVGNHQQMPTEAVVTKIYRITYEA